MALSLRGEFLLTCKETQRGEEEEESKEGPSSSATAAAAADAMPLASLELGASDWRRQTSSSIVHELVELFRGTRPSQLGAAGGGSIMQTDFSGDPPPQPQPLRRHSRAQLQLLLPYPEQLALVLSAHMRTSLQLQLTAGQAATALARNQASGSNRARSAASSLSVRSKPRCICALCRFVTRSIDAYNMTAFLFFSFCFCTSCPFLRAVIYLTLPKAFVLFLSFLSLSFPR